MPTEILTRKEAAQFLKLPIRTLDYLVATRQIPYSRVGKRSVRFIHQRLMDFLDEQEGVEYHRPKSAKVKAKH